MHELISVEDMRAIDASAAHAGVATRTLMENAGRAVADAIMVRFSPRAVAVLCGPGANGGDGWVCARILHEAGWPVAAHTLAPRDALRGDAADAAAHFHGAVHVLGAETPAADLYVDALFGAGLSRPLDGAALHLAQDVPAARIVAVDVPSGLDGDTGAPLGGVAFKAALTVTFVRKKPAHVLAPGRALCGEIVVADIGAPEAMVAARGLRLWENDPSLWLAQYPRPELATHKHARGHAICASGGATRTGAARLAARGALRAGAGLVTVLSPSEALAENAAHLTAIMLRAGDSAEAFTAAAREAHAMVIGPAFGTGNAHWGRLKAVLETSPRCPLVLDADALTLMAPVTHGLTEHDVMTPHVGEFRRAFPGIWSNTPSRIEAARAAAAYARCVVLLKGPDTVIAAPDGRAIVNTRGTPYLATAGSGDVLAGFVGGLIAQGMAAFEAAAASAWLHGVCAESFGPGLVAEDLPEVFPSVIRSLMGETGGARPIGPVSPY